MRKKVYIATSLAREKCDRFHPITRSFGVVASPDDAELIVVDLSHPPENWEAYVRHPRGPKLVLSPWAVPPCLFFDGDRREATDRQRAALETIKGILNLKSLPRVAGSVDDLLKDLEWLDSVVPLEREGDQRTVRSLALGIEKGRGA